LSNIFYVVQYSSIINPDMNIKPLPRYAVLILLLLNIPFLCYYNRRFSLAILAVLFILIFIFRHTKFSNKSTADKIEKKHFFFLLPAGKKETEELLYLIASLFVIIKFFEQNIAVFSISIILVYKFVSTIFKLFARVKIRGATLEGTAAGTIAVYFMGYYLCSLLELDKNIAVSSAAAVPLIELIVSWPDKNFSLPFLIAVVAQFVKNSF